MWSRLQRSKCRRRTETSTLLLLNPKNCCDVHCHNSITLKFTNGIYKNVAYHKDERMVPVIKEITVFAVCFKYIMPYLLTYLFTYLLTPWCRVFLEKLTGFQLVKKNPAFHETRMFITALTSVRHLSLSWANPIQSIYPHPTSWRSILILSTHLRLGLPSGLFPSGFPTKTLYTPLSSSIRATS